MAFTTEGFYEQENNQGITDRVEIQQDGGAGRNIELGADASRGGFRWRNSPITSESNEGLINPLANRIQVGKLTFFPRIDTAAKRTLVSDIVGSADTSFRLVWKIKPSGGSFSTFWTGNIDNKKRSFPETGGSYFAEIRSNDFEILKGIDYTLDDTRQTLITTIADLLGNLSFGLKIRTATSWITEDTTDSTDFLSQIYHETKALRDFGRTGDESDEPISVWEALEKIGGPALLFRQVNGEFTVEQLTEFDDPANVNETVYTAAGAVDTATTTVDRTLDADKSVDDGSLVVKDGSQNDHYPAIKRARVKFDHRNTVSGIQFPDEVELTGANTETFSEFFISDGTQTLHLTGLVRGLMQSGATDATADVTIRIIRSGLDDYYWDGSDWVTSTSVVTIDMTSMGGDVFQSAVDILTDSTPADADGTLEITLWYALDLNTSPSEANTTFWRDMGLEINNINKSTSDDFQLTQSGGYATNFKLAPTWFGDGPNSASVSALRHGTGDTDLTAESWQRRGSTSYRDFHENLLKEVLDLQRTNTRKLKANFWGTFDPTKILVYDSENFYCAGVSYVGVKGRWSATLFRVNVQTGSDTFEEIPKYSDTGTTTGSSGGSGGGTGGGISQSTADARYVNASGDTMSGLLTLNAGIAVNGNANFDIGSNEFRIQDGGAIFVADGATGQIGLGAEPVDDVGLLLDTPARAVTANTDYDRLKVASSGALTIAASTTSPIVATAQFDEPNITLASGASVTNAATVYVESAPTEGDNNYAIYAPSGISNFQKLEVGGTNLFPDDDPQALGTGDSPSFAGLTSTEAVTINFSSSGTLFLEEFGGTSAAVRASGFLRLESAAVSGIRFYLGDTNAAEVDSDGLTIREGGLIVGTTASFSGSETLRVNGDSLLEGEVDVTGSLEVDGGIFAREFTVEQTRVMFDFRLAPGGGKVESVSGSAGSETITLSNEGGAGNPLSVDAIILIQERTGQSSGTILKQIYRKVASINGMDATLTDSGITWTAGTDDTGSIEVGDNLIYEGHVSDSTLDHYIHFDIAGVAIPAIRIWDEVGDVGGGHEALRVGGMNGFDASITGDIGIAGATKTDGAVFWITEDEARLGAFTFNDEYLTDGQTYVGRNLSQFNTAASGNLMVGDFGTSGTDPRITLRGTSGSRTFKIATDTVAAFDASSNVVFQVDMDGNNDNIFGGTKFDNLGLWTSNADAADTFAGLQKYQSATDPIIFAGADDKRGTDYNFAVFNDGNIFHESIGGHLYLGETVASFGSNTSAASITDSSWSDTANTVGTSTSDAERVKIRRQYEHRFGINEIKIQGVVRHDQQTDSTANFGNEIRISIGGASASEDVSGVTYQTYSGFSFTLDVSGLTPGSRYTMELSTYVSVEGTGSGSHSNETELREDLTIIEKTG